MKPGALLSIFGFSLILAGCGGDNIKSSKEEYVGEIGISVNCTTKEIMLDDPDNSFAIGYKLMGMVPGKWYSEELFVRDFERGMMDNADSYEEAVEMVKTNWESAYEGADCE